MGTRGRTVKRRLAVTTLVMAVGAVTVVPAAASTATATDGTAAPAPADIALGSWMDQLRGTIGDRPMNQVVIPGSHDAGTAGITGDSGMCDAGDTVGTARKWPALAASMSRTQSGSLVQQLDGGSRYLDLRLCKQDGKWYSYHGGPLGRLFFDAPDGKGGVIPGQAREVADWIQAHPKEIVILRVTATGPAATLQQDRREAITELGDLVGGGAGHPAIADASLRPTSTYDQFMAAGRHVVIVDDTDSTAYPWAWHQPDVQDYRGSYVGVSTAWQDILKAALDPKLSQKTFDAVLKRGDEVLGRAPGTAADKFFVQQGIIDPTDSIPDAAITQILAALKLTSAWKADNFLLSLEDELNRQFWFTSSCMTMFMLSVTLVLFQEVRSFAHFAHVLRHGPYGGRYMERAEPPGGCGRRVPVRGEPGGRRRSARRKCPGARASGSTAMSGTTSAARTVVGRAGRPCRRRTTRRPGSRRRTSRSRACRTATPRSRRSARTDTPTTTSVTPTVPGRAGPRWRATTRGW
ncbi:hypothetical protein GTY20_02470 [Streptomyces sp. SID4946]|nr:MULTISPECIES: hypothetical protein [unclassified Streptomyces]MYQ90288.1 hypothetical protein [Streptomyces sp. SID4946]